MNFNDAMKLELLVAGELDERVRNEWLGSLEPGDKEWKAIALTFVEAQILHQQFSPTKHNSILNNSIESKPDIPAPTPPTKQSVRWLAFAATLLLGLVIGQLFSAKQDPVRDDTKMASKQTQSMDGAELPMDLADAVARCATPVPNEFRQTLLQAGYLLDEEQQMKEVQLPNGESIQMPIRQVSVHYLGMDAYQ